MSLSVEHDNSLVMIVKLRYQFSTAVPNRSLANAYKVVARPTFADFATLAM